MSLAENAVILVIHRGQTDPGNEEKIMSINSASGFASGLHLGTQHAQLHLLQLLAYGRCGETPKLLSDSDVNHQNQQLLFKLLQEILQVYYHHYPCCSYMPVRMTGSILAFVSKSCPTAAHCMQLISIRRTADRYLPCCSSLPAIHPRRCFSAY